MFSIVRGGLGMRFLDRRHEAIAAPRDCLDVTWMVGRIEQDFTDPHHGIVQPVIEVNKCVALPKPGAKFLASHYLARALQQQGQDLERLLRQLHTEAVLAKLTGLQVYLENAETNNSSRCYR